MVFSPLWLLIFLLKFNFPSGSIRDRRQGVSRFSSGCRDLVNFFPAVKGSDSLTNGNTKCPRTIMNQPTLKFSTQRMCAAAKSLQSCDPIDGSPPGSPVPGILQARTLEWVPISFSNTWKWKVKVNSLSRVWLLAIPWTAAHQAPPSMGFSRQEYWSGVPLPSPSMK